MCKDVCVIIPSYNNKEHLSKSLGSILRQKNIRQEVIITDDGSSGDTSEWLNHIAQRYDYIRIIEYNKSNIANARNLAIEKSNCKFIAFLDAGDTWYDNKLANQLQFMKTHPNCILTFTNYQNVDTHYQPIIDCFSYFSEFSKVCNFVNNEYITLNSPLNILLKNNIIGTSSVMVKREKLMKSGFDPSLKSASDWDCWLRLAMQGNFCFSHEITTDHLTPKNSNLKFQDKHLAALDEIITRIRAHPDVQPLTVKHAKASLNESRADHHRQLGHKFHALKHALQAVLLYPHKRNIKHFFHDIKQLMYI
ncbi:glycosyltransferase family 2 protein [Pseudoalteromonas denitrificans]|uniref:Glycosyl transferase family 2 n=1 Tax=Pseudoalteromonas denitrificans DSM 6059 TaxID=1123010 RepID=A0A1I1EPX6_9GAMM|nr:glycosyltransferase family A protein [Pseudoalteromonas denitrificans]SFB88712.1 Glycosyl transferase family 2 [Pseudoalteromonas denitrificans DSM 6059]